jgi:hypothetical protein
VPPEIRFTDGVRVACHLYPGSDAASVANVEEAPAMAPIPPSSGPADPPSEISAPPA